MSGKILFVDDEKNILSSLRRMLYKEGHDMAFADSGAKGLQLLKESPFAVIVSDMRMPEMNGLEFLKKSREICPDAVRIVLSGYSEINTIMEAVNQGHIWRYEPKPWEESEFKLTLKNALELHKHILERKQLLLELKRKNQLLEEMNTQLEQKIQERTWQLQERSELLNMLVEDSDYINIIKKSCAAISRQLDNQQVFVYAPHLNRHFSHTDNSMPPEYLRLAEDSIAAGSSQNDGKSQSFLLTKLNITLGALVVHAQNGESFKQQKDGIQCFSSIIALALSQHKSLQEAPDLLNNLDKIIGNLEE